MTRKTLAISFTSWFGMATAMCAPPDLRPNFLFILADDLGYMDVGANNPNTFYETPHIDHLASQGMRFTTGYASSPVCSPTRASLLTGKYPTRTGITDYIHPAAANRPENWRRPTQLLPASYADRLALEEVTVAEVLKENGYETFFAGKWHLGPQGHWPEDQGFNINVGGYERGGPKSYFSPYGNPRLEDGPKGEHLPDRLASETAAFIKDHRDEPFFAFLSFYSVHTPLETREDLKHKYEAKAEAKVATGSEWSREGAHKVRSVQRHAVYAGMVEALDQAVGKVLEALKAQGLEKNTIVFFVSDNGGLSTAEGHPTSNYPLRAGKGWLYEGGIREPMLIMWPGITPPGSVCDVPVITNDFYPTILKMAGLSAGEDQHHDAVSLVNLLKGNESLDRKALYWHYPHYSNQGGFPAGAIRSGDWKLIERYDSGRLELFDLKNDIGEQVNVAAKNGETVERLLKDLDSWRKASGARMPTGNPNAPPAAEPIR